MKIAWMDGGRRPKLLGPKAYPPLDGRNLNVSSYSDDRWGPVTS
jgi:hypothetical protein